MEDQTQIVQQFIEKTIQRDGIRMSTEKKIELQRLFLRVLSARLPTRGTNKPVLEEIQQQLIKKGRQDHALKMTTLAKALQKNDTLQNKENMIYFLYKLQTLNERQRKYAHNRPTIRRSTTPSSTTSRGSSRERSYTPTVESAGTTNDQMVDDMLQENPIQDVNESMHYMQQKQRRLSTSPSSNVSSRSVERHPSHDTSMNPYHDQFDKVLNMNYEVEESVLLRDMIYTFIGIDGQYIKFDKGIDGFRVVASVGCPKRTRDLIRKMCELGWLYKQINEFIEETTHQPSRGLALQSFCDAIATQLNEYYKLIVVLESNMQSGSTQQGNLSLRSLYIWTQQPLQRLKTLLMLVQSCRHLKGGQLASMVFKHTKHGDPFVRMFTTSILKNITSTFYRMIQKWIIDGNLEDPFQELFIQTRHHHQAMTDDDDDEQEEDENIWKNTFALREDMLPVFVSSDLASCILRIGKSINFLRECQQDNKWILHDSRSSASHHVAIESLGQLSSVVRERALEMDRALMRYLFSSEFDFIHSGCQVIKNYLLMGRGDFVAYYLSLVSPHLDKPSNSIDRYLLPNLLDKALKLTSASVDPPEVHAALSVVGRYYEKTNFQVDKKEDHAIRGWDQFSLEFKPSKPINRLFTRFMLAPYQKIFRFLLQLRRHEMDLVGVWKKQHELGRFLDKQSASVDSPCLPHSIRQLLRQCALYRMELSNFVNSMLYYFMFGVIETRWSKLITRTLEFRDGHGDMDALIAMHEHFPLEIAKALYLIERDSVHTLLLKFVRLIEEFIRFVSHIHDESKTLADRIKMILQHGADVMDNEEDFSADALFDKVHHEQQEHFGLTPLMVHQFQRQCASIDVQQQQFKNLCAQLQKNKQAEALVRVLFNLDDY